VYLKSGSAKKKKHRTKYEYWTGNNKKNVCVLKIGFREKKTQD